MLKVVISKMSETKGANSFKSYVGLDDNESQSLNLSGYEPHNEDMMMIELLNGEMEIAEAKKVLMFAPVSEQKTGRLGILRVTNFRLSFLTSEEKPKEELHCQHNHLLGIYEVCLSNVDLVFQMTGDKMRRLLPGSKVSGKVKGLHILCKNMKPFTFSFKLSNVDHGKKVTNALLHHAYPTRSQLLFAYDYREPKTSQSQAEVCSFRESSDWSSELNRTNCTGWRISSTNQNFHLSDSLPQFLVVPKDALDVQLNDAANHFRGNRLPVWCWGSSSGAALVRMADIQPTITNRVQENTMLERIRKSHPQQSNLKLLDLNKLPSIRDVFVSYQKLRELCAPTSIRQFWGQDSHFSSLLESSQWLLTLSSCLKNAEKVSLAIQKQQTVVIQEGDGRDMCCVVSSLAQLLLDKHWRTIAGFQTLIQKEWVALGHPFCSRLAHKQSSEAEQSPLFLVFLDCVWQLVKQFPTSFEFTETYLTTLWDSAHISLFETFLFDCERDRFNAATDKTNPLTLRSIWDWSVQFSEKDISLFSNPLFHPSSIILQVQYSLPMMQVWSLCYFRWIPVLEIDGGGSPMVDLHNRLLVTTIEALRKNSTEGTELYDGPVQKVSSFYPFTHISHHSNTGILSINSSFCSNDPMPDIDTVSLADDPD